jgi:SAM-dependent methyltransferase
VMTPTAAHWDRTYVSRGAGAVSWHQPVPTVSLELISTLSLAPDAPVVDVGGGASRLAAELVGRGYSDVSVLDVSESALEQSRAQSLGGKITWIKEDALRWQPDRRYALWHDRALLHFFVDDADRGRYLAVLGEALQPGGYVIVAAFAPDGPETCSGLPVRRYSAHDLKLLLGPGYQLREARRELHHTPTGKPQPFTWALFERAQATAEAAGRSRSASSPVAIRSGSGGQPGMRRSTGRSSSTAPSISSPRPSRLHPSAQSPSATTRRGSGIAR